MPERGIVIVCFTHIACQSAGSSCSSSNGSDYGPERTDVISVLLAEVINNKYFKIKDKKQ